MYVLYCDVCQRQASKETAQQPSAQTDRHKYRQTDQQTFRYSKFFKNHLSRPSDRLEDSQIGKQIGEHADRWAD
jgi:hypothetical protein